MLPEDIMNRIYTIYFSNHVLDDLKKTVNKITDTHNKTHYMIIEFEKPIEIYSGYVMTNIARYYYDNKRISLSNMYIALSNEDQHLRTFKSILTNPPIVF